jgi:hypothetical protein
LLLGAVSLITTLSYFFVPNNNTSANFKQKPEFLRKKKFSHSFIRETSKGRAGNFVEHVKLYLTPKVHEKLSMF